MKKLNKDNLTEFIEYFHGFHDSYITNINYDIEKSEIEIIINVCWSGNPRLKEDGYYEINKTKIRMIFNDIKQCNNKEIYYWDYISSAYIKYIRIDDEDFICFASDEEEPLVYILCKSIQYEKLK